MPQPDPETHLRLDSAARISLALNHPEDHRVLEILFAIFGAALETIVGDRLIEQYRTNCLERKNTKLIKSQEDVN